ncbi:MAG TPA: metal-dependent transcriptional regulator [Clostridiales bacterium]|nr:metal-dependent transcriptional regulator [Clostridiales bacterium]
MHESGEMYLESILQLTKEHGTVRSVDLAAFMGFSKPSVSRAVGLLKDKGYIIVDNGNLILTEEGRKLAERIYERHHVLTDFLVSIGVDETVADEDACRIEHVISEDSFLAIKEFIANR